MDVLPPVLSEVISYRFCALAELQSESWVHSHLGTDAGVLVLEKLVKLVSLGFSDEFSTF